MIEFIVAVDPRPDTKAKHFVSVAQALGRGLVRPWCHARKRDRFSAHPKPQKFPDRLGLLRHVALPSTHFFPRRAINSLVNFQTLLIGSYGVVPFAMKVMRKYVNSGKLRIGDFGSLGIFLVVEFSAHSQARLGSRSGNEFDDCAKAAQWFAAPVDADERKKSMLDFV